MTCISLQSAALSGQDDLADTFTAPVWGVQHAWKLPTLYRITETNIIYVKNSDNSCLSHKIETFGSHVSTTAFVAWMSDFLGREGGGKGRDVKEFRFPVRKYLSPIGHAKCYWSQVVGDELHSTGNQQNLVPNFRYGTLPPCTCLNKKYY